MKKENIKKIAIVIVATTIFSGLVLVLNSNLNKLKKIKSSIYDSETGKECLTIIDQYEGTFEDYISYPNETFEYSREALDYLYGDSKQHCSNGYKCENKPQITPMEVDDPECTTISADKIEDTDHTMGDIQELLGELYTAYNHKDFCPANYCVPETYEINLNADVLNGGTLVSQGTDKIYEKYNTAFYLDEEETKEMTSSSNPIEKPVMTISVTYDGNNQGATFTPGSTSVQTPFMGYSDYNYNGLYDQYGGVWIDRDGYNYSLDNKMYYDSTFYGERSTEGNNTLYAVYDYGKLKLPEITKNDHVCYWNIDTSKDTTDCDYYDITDDESYIDSNNTSQSCLMGGTTVSVLTNVVATAMCKSNPTINIYEYKCDIDGNNCIEEESLRRTEKNVYGTVTMLASTPINNYDTPSSALVTFGSNYEINFYHTYNGNFTNFGQGTNNSNYNVIVNNDNTAMTIYSDLPNANYVAIWPANAKGTYEKEIYEEVNNNFIYSNFNSSIMGPTSNGKYGTYFASLLSRSDDSTSWRDVLDGNAGNIEIRPYIRVIHKKNDGFDTTVGATQYKTMNSTITTLGEQSRTGYIFRGWKAYSRTTTSWSENEDGNAIQIQPYQSCGDVYYPANYTINATSWNLSNFSYPCPGIWGYDNGVITVYLEAVWQMEAWSNVN